MADPSNLHSINQMRHYLHNDYCATEAPKSVFKVHILLSVSSTGTMPSKMNTVEKKIGMTHKSYVLWNLNLLLSSFIS